MKKHFLFILLLCVAFSSQAQLPANDTTWTETIFPNGNSTQNTDPPNLHYGINSSGTLYLGLDVTAPTSSDPAENMASGMVVIYVDYTDNSSDRTDQIVEFPPSGSGANPLSVSFIPDPNKTIQTIYFYYEIIYEDYTNQAADIVWERI